MKKLICVLMAVAMLVSVLLLASCNGKKGDETTASTTTETTASTTTTADDKPHEVEWDGSYIDEDDFKAYVKKDLADVIDSMVGQATAEQVTAINAAKTAGEKAIDDAQTVSQVETAYQNAYKAVLDCVPLYSGLVSYVGESQDEKTNMLGILERYAVSLGITGLSLFENGGYVMYNPRITLGTETYIVGYGFGLLAEGAITADLAYETNPAWKRYLHTFEASDPGTLNYWNDQGSQIGDLFGYVGAAFFTNFMNETKDGYDWVPELAKEKPVAVNDDDGDGVCTTWRFEVKTGADGLKYSTASTIESRAAFNGREVALEDYEYTFKMMLTQANGLYRGSELANTKTGAIAGTKDYYAASANGFNEKAWENVGIKTYVEDGKNYFEVTFASPTTGFYCMYYISSGLYMPLPQEFVELVGIENLFGFNLDATETPLDNSLVLGPYMLETYDADQQIVYKKNPNYVFADTKYAVQGIHVKIFPAASTDETAGIKEFLVEHFDSTGIPQTYLEEYRNDPRTRKTTGDSVFKLNVNATDEATWEYLFGEEGVVTQTAKEDYWNLKPVMGNHHFVKGISLAIDRLSFANARGSIPSVDYLSSNYMSDPENGISYHVTEAHKKAVEALLEDTDGYGYSLELARDYFRLAMTELEAEGAYTPGTEGNPTKISIEIAWMYPQHEQNYHNEIKNFIETAFNDNSVTGGKYELEVTFWVGTSWDKVYYDKLMVGQYDIGFGSISGNPLDPLGFLNVLSSDQDISQNFTLNWGSDTNDPDVYPIVYRGARYSFDALYKAAMGQAIVNEGASEANVDIKYTEIVKNADGTYTGSFTLTPTLKDITTIEVTKVVCCNYERYYNGDGEYAEEAVEFDSVMKDDVYTVTFTVPAALAADYVNGSGTSEDPEGITGFDLYYTITIDGAASDTSYSVQDHFVLDAE